MSAFLGDAFNPEAGPSDRFLAASGIKRELRQGMKGKFKLGVLSLDVKDAPGGAEINTDFAGSKLESGARESGIPHMVDAIENSEVVQSVLGGLASGRVEINVILEHEDGENVLPMVDIVRSAKGGSGDKNFGTGMTFIVVRLTFGDGLSDFSQIIPILRDRETRLSEKIVVRKHGQTVVFKGKSHETGAGF